MIQNNVMQHPFTRKWIYGQIDNENKDSITIICNKSFETEQEANNFKEWFDQQTGSEQEIYPKFLIAEMENHIKAILELDQQLKESGHPSAFDDVVQKMCDDFESQIAHQIQFIELQPQVEETTEQPVEIVGQAVQEVVEQQTEQPTIPAAWAIDKNVPTEQSIEQSTEQPVEETIKTTEENGNA